MNFWDLIRVILNVGLNWLVNQPIVKKVVQAVQKPSATSKQPTKSSPEPDKTSVDPEVQRQQQEALRRQSEVQAKANQFDRDVSNMPRGKPVITRDEDSPLPVDDEPAVRLVEPVGKGLSLLVNPDAQRVAQAMQTTPGIVDTAIRATGSPSSAFRFMWADDPEFTDEQIAGIARYSYPTRISSKARQDQPTDCAQLFPDNTLCQDLCKKGATRQQLIDAGCIKVLPTSTPRSQALISLDAISKDYKYRDLQGKPAEMNKEQLAAFDTLKQLLDPENSMSKDSWWRKNDSKVTIDEILTLIAINEGGNVEQARDAIYAAYLRNLGVKSIRGFNINQDDDPSKDGIQNRNLDRLIRFLSYYQPWREPQNATIKFTDAMSFPTFDKVKTEVNDFLQNPEKKFGPDAAKWDPSNYGIGPTLNAAAFNAGFKKTFGDLPYHFANRCLYKDRLKDGCKNAPPWGQKLSDEIEKVVRTRKGITSTNSNTVYFAEQSGGSYFVVMTPNQVLYWCDSNDGLGQVMGTCI